MKIVPLTYIAVITSLAILTAWAWVARQEKVAELADAKLRLLEQEERFSQVIRSIPRVSQQSFGGAGLAVRSLSQPGSSGVMWKFQLDASQQYLLEVGILRASGSWTLRIDHGNADSATWIGLGSNTTPHQYRIAGASQLVAMIYSDESDVEMDLATVSLRPVDSDNDLDIPIVGLLDDSAKAMERHRQQPRWRKAFGLRAHGVADGNSAIDDAKAVASFVHGRSKVVSGKSQKFSGFRSPQIWMSDPHPTIDGVCDNFANAMVEGCARLGIIARPVVLASKRFYEGNALGDTHMLVEVFDPTAHRWILLDPTFNVCFRSDAGDELGIAQLMEYHRTGLPWHAIPLGPILPGRSLAEYYLPYHELLFMAQAPAVPTLGAVGQGIQSTALSMSEVLAQKYSAAK